MTEINHFHKGEIDVQKATGEQDIAIRVSNIIQEAIPSRAFDFIRKQVVVWIGIENENNYPCAFPLFGSPGFISPGEGTIVEIEVGKSFSIPKEWGRNLKKRKPIGCLIIDLSTRGRIRINGIIRKVDKTRLQIDVRQAYPNCQKYIRKRILQREPDFTQFQLKTSGTVLNKEAESIIHKSDTAFVASLGPNGADVSHRGGMTGFIKCYSPNMILIPDYKGNSMFNTLGNFKINPRGGITIIDFAGGNFLQVFGVINIVIDKGGADLNTGETNRFWELIIHEWHLYKLEGNFKWIDQDFSYYNP